MIRQLIDRSRMYLENFYKEIDLEQWEQVLKYCLQTKGHIYFTGIGKSGFVAKKIAMTLVSIGTKSFYLDPLNLLHGDLGILDSGDIVVVLSKSGFTKELIDIVPFIQKRGALIMAVTSTKESPLQALADCSVYLSVSEELDEHNLVPTTSTQVQLIFGDILAMAIMSAKEVDLELYAQLHPSGSIGKKLLTRVEELMLEEASIPFCLAETSVKEILVELTQKGCGCVIVTNQSKEILGVFTDGDLRRSLQKIGTAALDCPISQLMNREPVVFHKDKTALEAKKAMQLDMHSWINVLPIVEGKKVIGLLRMHDILKAGI